MNRGLLGLVVGFALLVSLKPAALAAADFELAANEAAPPDDVAADIAAQLAPKGWTLSSGGKPAFEFWPVKKWPVKEGFTATGEVLYPFNVGELVGVIRYAKSGTDFRNQKVKRGVFTVRYAQQPVDGNHVGTSETRDFFLLLPVADDTSPAVLAEDQLWQTSAKAAESNHPTMLSLLKTAADAAAGVVNDEARELTAVCFENPTSGGALKVTLVLVGHAKE